ncbi:MAG TPA: hypothetical protein VGH28_17645 [Polyangiaceae bacterium]
MAVPIIAQPGATALIVLGLSRLPNADVGIFVPIVVLGIVQLVIALGGGALLFNRRLRALGVGLITGGLLSAAGVAMLVGSVVQR